jgi:HD-GYP domain-containing protein (c-di-GMP phosphodiesterase class II)
MQSVLPVVLHHHESWDGKGYPHGLKGENIPFLARIAAVADAYDAMASDRPYRNGMPDDKLDEVIREGAGKQWDARVVEAFFRVRDDIREISRREHTQQDINALQFS